MPIIPISIVIFARNVTSSGLELWMQRREELGPLNGLLEFPGGKIEANEDSVGAASREVAEEVGIKVNENHIRLFKIYTHHYEDRSVSLFSHLCLQASELGEQGWLKVSFEKPLANFESKIPEANKQIIIDICAYLQELSATKTLEELWAIS